MEKLYFNLSNYNQVRIINAVKELIKKDGGLVLINKYHKESTEIEPSTHAASDITEEQRIRIESQPVVYTNNFSWSGWTLQFVLNGKYIYLSGESNPFFGINYHSIAIADDGTYIGKRYLYNTDDLYKEHKVSVSLAYDALFKVCNDDLIDELALDFYEKVKKYIMTTESESYCDRKRVYNYYNRDYHYEYKYDNTALKIDLSEVE